MPRKKKSGGIPPWLIPLIVILAAAAAYYALRQSSPEASLRAVEELDPDLYYDQANSLRGNTYKIDAVIDSSLGNSSSKGRLFSVDLNKTTQGGAPAILPILVPLSLSSLTIQKGQHYLMKVKVVDNGLLEVEEASKP